jgi:predicted CXXCH cytochrome family protein
VAGAAVAEPYSVVNSKHNLSISGPGTVRAATEGEVCIFCHAPHTKTGQNPLWNHALSTAAYTPYSSSTLKAKVGQPTGASKLCLSCHDGTVALGMVANRAVPIQMRGSGATMPAGSSRIGTDLSGHHPISFIYDHSLVSINGELRDPMVLQQQVRLDKDGQVQCTSCHDPHRNQFGQFLVKDNTASALCLDCHVPNQWAGSAHAISKATWNGAGMNPWPHTAAATVAANGCENCHAPHAAGNKPRLLNFARAEDNCLVCHNGNVAAKNVLAELNKPSAHPVLTTSSLHDAAEGPMTGTSRHAACVDCHNPHASTTGPATGAGLSGALAQVQGMSAGGALVKAVSKEYELCFRCHADSSSHSASQVARQFPQPNTRLQFSPGNASYHPVLGVAKSTLDSSLVSSWTLSQQMLCTDCHNNDQGPGAKGTGANGPHGSRYAPLLERNLTQVDFQFESPAAYALCYKCHSEYVLMADRLHGQHVRDQKTACSTCHDAHGVQNQAHLINFNTLYVQPLNGRIAYTSLGPGNSSCTLSCHGTDHNASSYSSPLPLALQPGKRR